MILDEAWWSTLRVCPHSVIANSADNGIRGSKKLYGVDLELTEMIVEAKSV